MLQKVSPLQRTNNLWNPKAKHARGIQRTAQTFRDMRRICQKPRPSTSRNFSKTSTPRSRDIQKYQRISRQTQNQNDPAANEGRQRTVPESREDESRNAKHAAAHRHMGNIRSTQKHMGTLAQSSILNRTIEQKTPQLLMNY